jgi:hypothetical protein
MADDKKNKRDVFDIEAYQQRRFIPADVDLCDAEVVASLYQQLVDKDIDSAGELDDFVDHRS